MAKEILHKYAEDSYGNIIHIDNAVKGMSYCCPGCKEEFIFRKGEIRQKHFSHYHQNDQSPNCIPESYLHKTFKKLLLEKILKSIKDKMPIVSTYKCVRCGKETNWDIISGICDAKAEYQMEVCRPDIALINEKGEVRRVIEIVVTHEPEEKVKKYYIDNNIILIQIEIKPDSIEDLENIDNKVKSSSNVFYLICPVCYKNYMAQQQRAKLVVQRPPFRVGGMQGEALLNQAIRNKQKQYFAIKNNYNKSSGRGSKK